MGRTLYGPALHNPRTHIMILERPWAAADDLFYDLGGAAENRPDPAEPPEPTIVPESIGLVLPLANVGLDLVSAGPGVRAV